MGKTYGYLKTNVEIKELLRKVEELKSFGVAEDDLYSDSTVRQSAGFDSLLENLLPGDVLAVNSAAALGSGFEEILSSWNKLTVEAGVDVVVLDMPLMDTRSKSLAETDLGMGEVVAQIVSYLSNAQRETARQRQAAGIAEAKSKGVEFGNRKIERPSNYEAVRSDCLARKITRAEAASLTGVSTSTFDRWIKDGKDKSAE